jgi:hypothetical protein
MAFVKRVIDAVNSILFLMGLMMSVTDVATTGGIKQSGPGPSGKETGSNENESNGPDNSDHSVAGKVCNARVIRNEVRNISSDLQD